MLRKFIEELTSADLDDVAQSLLRELSPFVCHLQYSGVSITPGCLYRVWVNNVLYLICNVEYFDVVRSRLSQTYLSVKSLLGDQCWWSIFSYSTEFSQRVCNEYMKFLNFEGYAIDEALRYFAYGTVSILYCIAALVAVDFQCIKNFSETHHWYWLYLPEG